MDFKLGSPDKPPFFNGLQRVLHRGMRVGQGEIGTGKKPPPPVEMKLTGA
jgi:hypothetical protein